MRDRRNTFEVGEGLLYKGEEERIEQEEQYPEKRDFCFYIYILRMLSLFSSFRKEENRDTTDF
ncbi:hypothetical protein NXY15_05365 [Bacteroides thetaiotaomicron]|nr:hypothetical protein NXY15_05365 [Bacteroides thetaiotaomicron]